MTLDQVISELGRFCDLDSDPSVSEVGADILLRFHQRGELITLKIDNGGGRVLESRDGDKLTHRTYRGLLASKNFGDLKRLVEVQRALLFRDAPYIRDTGNHLPVVGDFEPSTTSDVWIGEGLLSTCDAWLAAKPAGTDRIRALVIDGPAGIGKTHLIRRLVFDRLTRFGPGSPPPILHVQSRGRKLTTLNDVIAGTLQTLRIGLTFDQVPVLARHGLLQIAIDGFDELADPNGYDTAWGSVRDFLEDISGEAAIILAGRETFIDAESVRKALPRLDTPATAAVHLRHLSSGEAHEWLKKQEWPESRLDALDTAGLLEDGSYALRPFFISQIAKFQDARDFEQFIEFPLKALITQILFRESELLSSHLSRISSHTIAQLLFAFYEEIAREMSDAEVDSIDDGALGLIAEIVFSEKLNSDELAMLRYRVKALVLLEQDITPDRRRFSHTEINDFFLSNSYIRNIINGEIPKSIRRNITGQDTLETFFDVSGTLDVSIVRQFLASASNEIARRGLEERGRRNLAALCLAAVSAIGDDADPFKLADMNLDEAIFRGTVGPCDIVSVDFAQLDVRGANLARVQFSNCRIGALVGDSATQLPKEFPSPGVLYVEEGGRRKHLFDARQHREWIATHSLGGADLDGHAGQNAHEVLFSKICRVIIRQNWIRLNEDDRAGKLLDDPLWSQIRSVLEQENLLMSRSLAAQGPRSEFIRIRRARELLDPANPDPEIRRTRYKIASLVVGD